MLTNPLPQNQNMNSRTHDHSGGDQYLPEGSGRGCINMVRDAKVVTRVKDYGSSQPSPGKEPNPPGNPLCIEKPVDKLEVAPHIPKGVLKCSGHNPNARAAQNYYVVEDLGHTPCAMSALEVLQSCHLQRKALLSSLGVNDDNSSSMIKFETAGLQPRFPYYVSLLIHVECLNMTIKHTVSLFLFVFSTYLIVFLLKFRLGELVGCRI